MAPRRQVCCGASALCAQPCGGPLLPPRLWQLALLLGSAYFQWLSRSPASEHASALIVHQCSELPDAISSCLEPPQSLRKTRVAREAA